MQFAKMPENRAKISVPVSWQASSHGCFAQKGLFVTRHKCQILMDEIVGAPEARV
jgi:hypothetical protein